MVGLCARGLVTVSWLEGQTWRDLQREMQGGPWHIFHFVGHGGFDDGKDEGFVCLTGEDGRAQPLGATQLGRLLADHRSLRLVLLNACEGSRGGGRDVFSSTASILVRRGVPAVLAMQYEITDGAAIEFARAFYEALSRGLSVDAAVAEARKAVSLEVANTVEWGTPVLYMRTPDGVLFDVVPGPVYVKAPVGTTERAGEAKSRRGGGTCPGDTCSGGTNSGRATACSRQFCSETCSSTEATPAMAGRGRNGHPAGSDHLGSRPDHGRWCKAYPACPGWRPLPDTCPFRGYFDRSGYQDLEE